MRKKDSQGLREQLTECLNKARCLSKVTVGNIELTGRLLKIIGAFPIWVAEYCPNEYESAYGVLSLHLSKGGAETALEKHQRSKDMRNPQSWQKWRVRDLKLKD